jgi:aminoglycoside phosphotransferase
VTAVAEGRLALAPDPELPQRDVLLDPAAMAERLAERLGRDGDPPIDRCERLRAKYQVGRSLRVLYGVEVCGERRLVAARTFRPERSLTVYREALDSAVATGVLRPVGLDPELATVFWTFPNDRKIANLAALAHAPEELARATGRRWERAGLAAYAPEKSATARCVGADGKAVAFAKVYADDRGQRTHRIHAALGDLGTASGGVRVPRALAYSRPYRTLLVEPVDGRAISELGGHDLEQGLAGLGAALGALHRHPPPSILPRARRLRPERLAAAAELIGRARPDAAARARELAGVLAGSFEESRPVFLHGDAHPQNGIVDGDAVALIDLDQACAGPAATDLGGLLATLAGARCLGELSAATERRLRDAVLAGFAEATAPPPTSALRWHVAAALLVERALRSVQRVREAGLARLDAVLDAAEASCP